MRMPVIQIEYETKSHPSPKMIKKSRNHLMHW